MSEEEKTGIIRFEAGTVAGALNSRVMNIVQRADQEGESQQLEAQAREIFEEDFIGVEEVENALDVNISRNIVPQIPFTEGELVVAQKRGQRLVLRISHINDKPLTMQSLNTHVQRIFDEEEMGKVLYLEKWYKDDPFFTEMVPETRWALVTNGALEGSLDMNYLEQTQLIVEYFKEGLFEGVKLPSKYANAIAEFEMQRGAIERLMEVDDDEYQKKVTERLTKLNLTKLTRPTPVEAFYDEVVYFQHRKDSLLDSIRILTSIKTADGTILGIGEFDVEGMSMHRCWPEEVDFKTGACVCRY